MFLATRRFGSSSSPTNNFSSALHNRSHSVLFLLWRLRQQQQQQQQQSQQQQQQQQQRRHAQQTGGFNQSQLQQVDVAAMRLLDKQMRGTEPLSDVDPNSAAFAIEIGKLLTVAATFQASTRTPRVAEALTWIGTHQPLLQTTRQVMSLCMPLLHLSDGATAGKSVLLTTLYVPLLESLQRPAGKQGDAAEETGGAASHRHQHAGASNQLELENQWKQNISSLVSVLQLTLKLLQPPTSITAEGEKGSAATEGEDKTESPPPVSEKVLFEKCVTLHAAANCALSDYLQHLNTGNRTLTPITVTANEAQQLVSSLVLLESDEAWAAATGTAAEKDMLRTLLRVSHAKVIPLVEDVLRPTSGASHRAAELVALLQAISQLSRADEVARLSPLVVAQLAPALSSCNAKDLMNVTQTLVRIVTNPTKRAVAALDAATLQQIMAALRPKLFKLAEPQQQQQYALRPYECSMLLLNLSRLDGVTGGSVPTDVIELLCRAFTQPSQQSYIQPSHVVSMTQALVRLQQNHRQRHFLIVDDSPTIASTLDACYERVLFFCQRMRSEQASAKREEGAAEEEQLSSKRPLQPHEAALLLLNFSLLRHAECAALFSALEPCFKEDVGENTTREAPLSSQEVHTRRLLVQALHAFIHYAPSLTLAPSDAVQRAEQLLRRLLQESLTTAATLKTPKDLVLFFQALRKTLSAPQSSLTSLHVEERAAEEENTEDDEPDVDDEEDDIVTATAAADTRGDPAVRVSMSQLIANDMPTIVAQLVQVAPQCNLYEAGELSLCIALLTRAEGVSPNRKARRTAMVPSWAVEATRALAQQAATLAAADKTPKGDANSIQDVKKLLDAARTTKLKVPVVLPVLKYLETLVAARTERNNEAGAGASADIGNEMKKIIALGKTLFSYVASVLPSSDTDSVTTTEVITLHASLTRDEVEVLCRVSAAYFRYAASVLQVSDAQSAAMPSDAADDAAPGKEAKENTNEAFPSLSSALRVDDLILLAYTIGQLHRQVSTLATASFARGSDEDTVTPRESDALFDLGTLEPEASQEEEDDDAAARPRRTSFAAQQKMTARMHRAVAPCMQLIGDITYDLLQGIIEVDSSPSAVAHTATGEDGEVVLSGKYALMLLQSYEMTSCTHATLLSYLLAAMDDLAPSLDPLELSLLINALSHVNFWNVRLINNIVDEVATHKLQEATLRQCHGLLRGLERSGFLRPQSYLWPLRDAPRDTAALQAKDWRTSSASAGFRRHDQSVSAKVEGDQTGLTALAQHTVERLDSFILSKEAVRAVVDEEALADLVSVVRALAYFDFPPQPTFDTYFALSVKKYIAEVRALDTTREASAAEVKREARKLLGYALYLFQALPHLRRYDHQVVSSQSLVHATRQLECTLADHRISPSDLWTALSLHQIMQWFSLSRQHYLLYGTDLLFLHARTVSSDASDGVPTPPLLAAMRKAFLPPAAASGDLVVVVQAIEPRRAKLMLTALTNTIVPVPLDEATQALPQLVLNIVSVVLSQMADPTAEEDGAHNRVVGRASLLATCCGALLRCLMSREPSSPESADTTQIQAHLRRLVEKLSAYPASTVKQLSNTDLCHLHHALLQVLAAAAPSEEPLHPAVLALTETVAAALQQAYTPHHPLRVADAVTVLLGAARHSEAVAAQDQRELRLFLADGVRLAGLSLSTQLQREDVMGRQLLGEVYRLLVSEKGVFVRWTLSQRMTNGEGKGEVEEEEEEADEQTENGPSAGPSAVVVADPPALALEVLHRSLLTLVRIHDKQALYTATASMSGVCLLRLVGVLEKEWTDAIRASLLQTEVNDKMNDIMEAIAYLRRGLDI